MLTRISSLPIWVRLVVGILLVVVVSLGGIVYWSVREQERSALAQAQRFAGGLTQVTLAALFVTMQSGEIDQQGAFLDRIRQNRGVQELTLLRGAKLDEQFGKRTGTRAPDATEERVIAEGKSYDGLEESGGKSIFRTVAPIVAMKSGGYDCVKCHQVPEGTVLGAITIRISMDEVRQATADVQRNMLIITLLVVAVLIAITYVLLNRTLSRPLGHVIDQLRDISEGEGDLTRRLDVRNTDEIGQLALCFNTFVEKLHDILSRVKGSATDVAAASQQLSSASEQLAAGAHEQAASLEETAAALEEMTSTVKQSADNARQASQLAGGSRASAEKGGEVVGQAVAAMAEINSSSTKIADIITTIDEIAFQTNLLALNAAVEAARAGEQGRGFAVVAAEVRNLAQRSATAAKEIKTLIGDSVQKVHDGSALVTQSGESLNEIVTAVKRVTDVVAEITAASQEQSTGIDQVNKAVTQMDQVTQANASQTEELASTAEALANQAGQLQAIVARFNLGQSDGRSRAVSAPTVAPKATTPTKAASRLGASVRRTSSREPALAGAHAATGSAPARDDGFEEF